MEYNYSNELIEVDSANTSKGNGKTDENTVQLIQNFTSTIIGLSQQLAENNAAKYRAQAEVMIAEIQAKMQEECQDMSGYYNTREQQEEDFRNIIMIYQEQFNKLTNHLLTEENEKIIENLKWSIQALEKGIGNQLDHLAENIAKEQNARKDRSESRGKRWFGFFRRG